MSIQACQKKSILMLMGTVVFNVNFRANQPAHQPKATRCAERAL